MKLYLKKYVPFLLILFLNIGFEDYIPDSSAATEIKKYDWYNTAHHTKTGIFINPGEQQDQQPHKHSFFRSFSWVFKHMVASTPKVDVPFQNINPTELTQPVTGSVRVFWLGHSSCLIQTKNQNILLDPMFSKRASPVSFAGPKRLVNLPIKLKDLPKIDVVVISHNHYDHLDKQTIIDLNRLYKPMFIVPLEIQKLLKSWKISNIIELDWWEYVDINSIRYNCTPAKHFSSRSTGDRNKTLWAGWYIHDMKTNYKIFFVGDSAYGPVFSQIKEKLGAPNLEIAPIGAYEPQWFMSKVHINPEQAIQSYIDLSANKMLAVHWGTFILSQESVLAPPETLKKLIRDKNLDSQKILVLPVGGIITDY